MDQFSQIKNIHTSLLEPRQESTRTAFCNYLTLEVENLEERDFLTFLNEAVKCFNRIQSKPENRNY